MESKYKTIEKLQKALKKKEIDPANLYLYLEEGIVLILEKGSDTRLFWGTKDETLSTLFSLFFKIDTYV